MSEIEKNIENKNIYSVISNIFLAMHRVDLKTGTYETIKTTKPILKYTIPNSNSFKENVESIIKGLAVDVSYSSAISFLNLDTLKERLTNKNHISIRFEGKIAGMCRLHFIKEDKDEEGDLWHVIFAVEVIDEDNYQSIFSVLTKKYENVYWLNLKDATVKTLKYTGEHEDIGVKTNISFPYSSTVDNFINNKVYVEDRDALAKSMDIENVRNVLSKQDEYVGNYRKVVDNKLHNYQFSFTKFSNSDYVLIAFLNIDDIIEEHLSQDKKEREIEKVYNNKLREQLAIFNGLADTYSNVFLVDPDKKTIKIMKLNGYVTAGISKGSEEVYAYDVVKNQYVNDRVLDADKEMMHKAISLDDVRANLKNSNEYTGNYRVLDNGEVHNYQFKYIRLKEFEYVIAGFQNIDEIIDEHLKQEKKQREIEEKYQSYLKEQLTIFNNLARNFRNVYLGDLNDGTARILKLGEDYDFETLRKLQNQVFSFETIIKKWVETRVHKDDRERLLKILSIDNLREVFSKQDEFAGTYRSYENGVLHNYQFNFSKLESGKVIAGFQIIDDIIAEHLKQEKRQRELEEAHQKDVREHTEVISALANIYSTIFRANIVTHEYEVLNSVELMGKVANVKGNFDDVKENIIKNFISPDMADKMREFLDFDSLNDRLKDINTVVTEYTNPDGRWFQARFIVKNRDENGDVKEVLYVARDFTKEKEIEIHQQEQLSLALKAAQQANRAKSTFLNSMSHDIRTPMNAIIGFTALAQTHVENKEQVQDYLAKINTSSTHLLSLINDILDMSRIESGTVKLEEKPVHIPELLHDLRTMIQGLVNSKNQNLYIDTQDVIHEDVITDKLRLNQILINIVGNAIKFTQNGGDIIIRLIEKPCSIKHYTTYEFSVKDNGIGMSKEFMGHIFDTFSREYSSTVSGIQGTGLGMAITKNIVEMMGGTIEVESEEGRGSKFTVTLNLRQANEPIKYSPIPELLGARALVVDDDINTCRSVCKMLRDIKMRPDWTVSGREAILRAQDAKELNDEYKVYIIDYLMPDMNGIETVRRIRKVIGDDVPIIVLIAYDWDSFEEEARKAGVTAFVSKPIFMSELRAVLTKPVEVKEKTEEVKYDYTGKCALLVEDNNLNQEIAKTLLEETGMKVDCANDGIEAVEIINNSDADRYDIILMDIQMPRMDGYTATREIRTLKDNRKANIPIVAMTANAFEEDKKKALETGMNGHIVKPISIDSIANVLNEIFNK